MISLRSIKDSGFFLLLNSFSFFVALGILVLWVINLHKWTLRIGENVPPHFYVVFFFSFFNTKCQLIIIDWNKKASLSNRKVRRTSISNQHKENNFSFCFDRMAKIPAQNKFLRWQIITNILWKLHRSIDKQSQQKGKQMIHCQTKGKANSLN